MKPGPSRKSVNIEAILHQKMRARALKEGVTVEGLYERVVREFLKNGVKGRKL